MIAPDQRHAWDILVWRNGGTHRGDGKRLTDYWAFGRPILAPAPARVIEAVDGLPDNVPGHMDPQHAAGNHVVLDLGHGEYALIAHLRHGSVAVKVGDRVRTGQLLGRCGNSGNTSEPHVHFHVQDGPTLFRARACRSSSRTTSPTAGASPTASRFRGSSSAIRLSAQGRPPPACLESANSTAGRTSDACSP